MTIKATEWFVLWLQITAMRVLGLALRRRWTQLSPFLSPINEVPCWQWRYSNRIKTIRVSPTVFHNMAHTAILSTVLHHWKKMDLTPARLSGAIQVSVSCRALRDHIPKCPDSPWAGTALCSDDSLKQTPPGDTTSHHHQTHLHSLSLWQWNFCFSIQTENQYLWSVIRSKHTQFN